ncbi:surface protein PspC [Streptococcus pneumoniae]|uniref:RICH domain-containing protein n=1 Tax=Streptococcus pneumoniae TaxID=1313 RepID=UPI000B58A714|nr:RICH domain-containing protein [Streptococcus pneumoniae]SNK27831.1 surface protein PspC [Streptococcus pneumoniae]
MFASKSERKVHYSIRKFSIGVASVAVASLFLGGVVHAEGVRSENTPKVTSSGDEVDEYIKKMLSEIQLDKRKHTHNFALNLKLSRIKTEYLYKLKVNVLEEKSKAELTSKTKKEVDAAFEKFKKDTLKLGEKVAEAQKKVEEAKKKAKDQKEEDHRNYPTITYKTLELEIAEFDVKVKEAELELLKVKAKESRDEKKIKQAEAEVESKQAEATRLKKIKTDRKKAEEEAKLKEAVEKNAATSEQGKPKRRVKRGALGEQATPDKKDYFEKDFRPAFNKNQQMVAIQESLNKLDDETKTVPDGAKLTGEAGNAYNEVRDYAIKVVSENKKLLSQTAVTMDELAMQLTKLNDAMSKLKEAKAKLVPEVKPQPENPEHQKPTTPAPDTKPIPQPEGKKPSVPDINQEKEKAKLAVATYMSKILDDIQKHHLQKEKHRQIVALIKELDEFKKQALSEIDNVNTKVEIENTVHKIFADMDAVVTKFKKGLTQDTPKEPDNKKPSAPKPDMQPSPQPEGKKPSVPAQPGTEDKKLSAPKPDMQPSPQPEGKKPSVPEINQEKEKAKLAVATEKKLPSTGVASNLVLEIIGLLGLIGTSFIAMKRRK